VLSTACQTVNHTTSAVAARDSTVVDAPGPKARASSVTKGHA